LTPQKRSRTPNTGCWSLCLLLHHDLLDKFAGHSFSPKVPDGAQQWYKWPTLPDGDRCMTMGNQRAGNFDDIPCGDWIPLDMDPLLPQLCRRSEGYRLGANGMYYKVLHNRNINALEAKQLCANEGARLANAPYGDADQQAIWSSIGSSFQTWDI
jgi:hypothetical protein